MWRQGEPYRAPDYGGGGGVRGVKMAENQPIQPILYPTKLAIGTNNEGSVLLGFSMSDGRLLQVALSVEDSERLRHELPECERWARAEFARAKR